MNLDSRNRSRKSPKKQSSPTADPIEWGRRYISFGFRLCKVAYASKAPVGRGWQRTPVDDPQDFDGFGIGLNHALSRTAALDIDALVESRVWFEQHGIDLDAILEDGEAVGLSSGRPNRTKRIYRLPADETPLKTRKISDGGRTLFELRCDGAQDILPPSIHEQTRKPYEWVGDWKKLTELPPELLALWKELNQGHASSRVGNDGSQNDPFSIYRNPRQIAEAEAALAVIPWEGMTDGEWINLMFAAIDAGIDGGTFFQWGSKSPECDEEGFWKRWDSCYRNRFGQEDGRRTQASLFKLANEAAPGWREEFRKQWREPK